jgi:hypothetical protein
LFDGGAGDIVCTVLRLVMGAKTDGGPLALTLFGVDAVQSAGLSLFDTEFGATELVTNGDALEGGAGISD